MKTRLTRAVFRCAILVVAWTSYIQPANATQLKDAVYAQVISSTAYIVTPTAAGSGFLVDAQRRLVVTNWHVAGKAKTVHVVFPILQNGRPVGSRDYYLKNSTKIGIAGKVVASSVSQDFALIQLPALPPHSKAVRLSPKPAHIGDWTLRIASPAAKAPPWRAITGFVTKADHHSLFDSKIKQKVVSWMVTINAPTVPGDSGGPVFNNRGELVAVHHARHKWNNTPMYSCAIDVRELANFLKKTWYLANP
jgi:S1-C subfamily serine protease